MGDFLRALSLLTRLPVRARWDDDVLPGRAMAAYPLVGVLIGTLLVGLGWLLTAGIGRLQGLVGGSGVGLSPLLAAALSRPPPKRCFHMDRQEGQQDRPQHRDPKVGCRFVVSCTARVR